MQTTVTIHDELYKQTLWPNTLKLWLFGLIKIPMVYYLRPRVVEINDQRAVLRMPFARRAKNHLNSMYFGALCACADIVGGLHTMHFFGNRLNKFSFVFKNVNVEFLKRAEGDVIFVCDDGMIIGELIAKAGQSKQRENALIMVNAYTAPDVLVAQFKMTLSVKARV